MAGPTNQALRFERLKEFNNIGKKLGSGNAKVLSQLVRDLIDGITLFQQFPNLQSDGIETEANPLLDIQQDGSVLGSSFPDARCDHDVFGSNIGSSIALPSVGLLMLLRPSIGENMPLHVSICKETFLLQEFVQTGFRSELRRIKRTRSFDQQL